MSGVGRSGQGRACSAKHLGNGVWQTSFLGYPDPCLHQVGRFGQVWHFCLSVLLLCVSWNVHVGFSVLNHVSWNVCLDMNVLQRVYWNGCLEMCVS